MAGIVLTVEWAKYTLNNAASCAALVTCDTEFGGIK